MRSKRRLYGFLREETSAVYGDLGSQLLIVHTGPHLDLCDRRDRRQGFAPETERSEVIDVVQRADFRRSMTFERQAGIRFAHATTVIRYLNQGFTPVSIVHRNRMASRIDRIFHQLLDNRCRPFNDLTGGNLVGNSVGQYADTIQFHLLSPLSID